MFKVFKFLFGKIPTKEFVREISVLSGASFGLIAALAWNQAIQELFNKYLSFNTGSEVISRFLYAIFITAILVIVTIQFAKLKHGLGITDEQQENRDKKSTK